MVTTERRERERIHINDHVHQNGGGGGYNCSILRYIKKSSHLDVSSYTDYNILVRSELSVRPFSVNLVTSQYNCVRTDVPFIVDGQCHHPSCMYTLINAGTWVCAINVPI